MKSAAFYIASLSALLLFSCHKEPLNKPVYLLHQQITDDRADGIPLDTATYTYDGQNRIISITDNSGGNRITYTISYDNENRLATGKKLDGNGQLITGFDFFYRGDSTGYYFYGPSHVPDTAYFHFNGTGQLTSIETKHSGSQLFTYDARGNISTSQAIAADGSSSLRDQISFAYDSKRNPFANAAPNNYFFMYVIRIGNPSTLINNPVFKNGETFAYSYNTAGFPTSATIKTYSTYVHVSYVYLSR